MNKYKIQESLVLTNTWLKLLQIHIVVIIYMNWTQWDKYWIVIVPIFCWSEISGICMGLSIVANVLMQAMRNMINFKSRCQRVFQTYDLFQLFFSQFFRLWLKILSLNDPFILIWIMHSFGWLANVSTIILYHVVAIVKTDDYQHV